MRDPFGCWGEQQVWEDACHRERPVQVSPGGKGSWDWPRRWPGGPRAAWGFGGGVNRVC